MYNKVPTDLNFVAREKKLKILGRSRDFQKSIDNRKRLKPIPSMTALQPPTENLISAMSSPVLSRI